MAAAVLELTDGNFQTEVLQSSEPVLVDFWAPWCPPCRQIAPMIQELAGDNVDKAKVGKLNIDSSPQSTAACDVSAIPTLLIFKGGEVVERFVGTRSKAQLQKALDAAHG